MLPSSLNQNSPWISPFSQSEAFFLFQLFFFRILKWESILFAKTSTKWSEFKVEIFSDEWNSRFWFHSLLSLPPQQSSWGWCFCRPLTSLGKMKHNITNFSPSFHLVFHDFSCLLSFSSFRFSSHWISNFPDLTFVSPSLYLNMILPYMFLTLVSTWRTWRRDTSKSCAFQDALFFFRCEAFMTFITKVMRSEREDGWDNLSSFSYQFSDLIWRNLHVVKRKVSCSPRSESSSCSRAMTLAVRIHSSRSSKRREKLMTSSEDIVLLHDGNNKMKVNTYLFVSRERDWSQQHDDAAHSTEQGSNFKLKLTSSFSLRGWDQTQIFAFYEIFLLRCSKKASARVKTNFRFSSFFANSIPGNKKCKFSTLISMWIETQSML